MRRRCAMADDPRLAARASRDCSASPSFLVVGWLVSSLLARGVAALLQAVNFNDLARRSGFAGFVQQHGRAAGRRVVIAGMAKWFVRLITLVVAFDLLGLPAVSVVFQQLLLWLPNLIVALVVLVIGGLAAKALSQLVRGTTAEAGFNNPDVLAAVTKVAVWAFAIVVAVNQLGIATTLINTLLIGVVGALALASGPRLRPRRARPRGPDPRPARPQGRAHGAPARAHHRLPCGEPPARRRARHRATARATPAPPFEEDWIPRSGADRRRVRSSRWRIATGSRSHPELGDETRPARSTCVVAVRRASLGTADPGMLSWRSRRALVAASAQARRALTLLRGMPPALGLACLGVVRGWRWSRERLGLPPVSGRFRHLFRERRLKIAVCIKRVPDMELRFSIAADRKSLDQAGLKYDMSDFDGYALEVALQLVEKQGPGEVVLVCVGPDGVQETLRKGLAMGAARAVQLKADEVPVDGLAIARALAAELKDGGYDLILFGRMATDTASGTVGPMVAELLDLPCVTAISHLEIARRPGDGATRSRGRGGDRAVPAAGGAVDRRGHRAAAARDAQGDHGRQEEAARDQARRARRGAR